MREREIFDFKLDLLLDQLVDVLMAQDAGISGNKKIRARGIWNQIKSVAEIDQSSTEQCPLCFEMVTGESFFQHITKCSQKLALGLSEVVTNELQSPEETKVNNTAGRYYENYTEEYSQERQKDASRDFHAPFREGGKFGSHAAYDDMDDESFA